MVDLMNIPFHNPDITQAEIDAVTKAMSNKWLTMGKQTFAFEQSFKKYIGASDCKAVNSCTAALHLVLKCIGLDEGDEVIVPAITFAATAGVVTHFKAKPVIVDVDRKTHLIDVSMTEQHISSRTKAIIPVHFSGQPADMDELMELGKDRGVYIIDDAAHALPSEYKGKKIGSFGDATCFSFYATKTLATGEGGMVATTNSEWSERIERLRLHGINKDAWNRYSSEGSWMYDIIEPGYKYNTTDINAAMGIEQLKKIDTLNARRITIAEQYNRAFQNNDSIFLYEIKEDRKSCWHLYPVKLNLDSLGLSRGQFLDKLRERGIGTSVHFIPLHHFSYYKQCGYVTSCYPNSNWIFERVFSLPIYPSMNDGEVNYVIENVIDILNQYKR